MTAPVSSSSSASSPYGVSKPQAGSGTASPSKSSGAAQSAEEKFLAYAKMSPAEKLRAALLSQLGLTEEQVQAMPPEERQKVEQKITELLKQAAQKKAEKDGQTGFFTDIKA